jgi:acyl-CoA thioesterase II
MSEQTDKRVSAFDRGVRLERSPDGRWRGEALRPWRVYQGPNGGYLAAIILNAQIHELGDPSRSPRAFNVHFVDRAVEGELVIEVTTERVGRSFASTTARMFQEGRLCATSNCSFSIRREGESYDEHGMPEVADPDDLPPTPVPPEMLPDFARNFDYRFALGNLPYTSSPNAVLGGWMRPADPYPVDEILLACYSDAMPPAVFTRLSSPVDAPTVDLTVHFLGEPPRVHDWVLCRFESPVADNGVLIEDGSMWSKDGRLLARSRQLALFKKP